MKASVGVALTIFVACFTTTSCSTCCTETTETYVLSGERPPQGSSCPAIVADFYEDESVHCASGCTQSGATPGSMLLEQSLGSGPTWSANVSVTYAGNRPPSIDVYAYCDANQSGRFEPGELCVGSTSLPAGSNGAVKFDRSDCPGRL